MRPARRTRGSFSHWLASTCGGELNDLARRLDTEPVAQELPDESVPAPASSDSGLTPDGRRILEAIERLPEEEREAFDLVRIQKRDVPRQSAQVLGSQ